MWRYFARVLRAVTAVCALACIVGLTGCAGSGERLPACRGTPQPINAEDAAVPAVVVLSSQARAH